MNTLQRIPRVFERGIRLCPSHGSEPNKIMGPLVSLEPLPRGDVKVFALEHLDHLPRQVGSEKLSIQVYDVDGVVRYERSVMGRAGCLALYTELIGYDPSEEAGFDRDTDDHALLCLVTELVYRTTCEDFN